MHKLVSELDLSSFFLTLLLIDPKTITNNTNGIKKPIKSPKQRHLPAPTTPRTILPLP